MTATSNDYVPSAVQRLFGTSSPTYLGSHHVEAAARLTRLFELARLSQRVTMSFDPTRVGKSTGNVQVDMSTSASHARRILNDLARRLPSDCWGLLVDVCLYDRGLQDVEASRQWPRRAAKLVLRIGLDHVATQLGLDESARGRCRAGVKAWLPERLPMFSDPGN